MSKGKDILDKLVRHGFEAYFVGGCVRDLLLNRQIHDVDICTSARPEQVRSVFEHTIPTGIKHGTVTVLWQGERFEVTTYRSEEKYTNYRHPHHVTYETLLRKDLERRDFTINAMAMDKEHQLFDFFGGQKDLQNGRIETVGRALDRFSEDALRMLRGIRFSAQLGFYIGDQVVSAMCTADSKLNHISIERKTSEFEKIIAATYPNKGIYYLLKGGIAEQVTPFQDISVALHEVSKFPLHHLQPLERWLLILSCTLHREKEIKRFLHSLTLRKKRANLLITLFRQLILADGRTKATQFKPLELFHMGEDHSIAILKVNQMKALGEIDQLEIKEIERIFASFPIKKSGELQLSGQKLISALGKKPGPWVGTTLELLVDAVVTGKVNNNEQQLLTYIRRCDIYECH